MDDRADVLTRDRRGGAPYELGGEFWQRLVRLLQTYLGVDPQQLATVPRVELAHQVAAAVLLADATQPPYRKVGKAFSLARALPQPSPGNFIGEALGVLPSVNGIAVIDWIDLAPASAGRVQIGMITAPLVTPQPVFSLEDRPTAVVSGSLVPAQMLVRAELSTLPTNTFSIANPSNLLWVGGAGPATVRVTFGDLVIWPGAAVLVEMLTAAVALDVVFKGRYFDLAQLGSGQNF